MFCPFRSVHHQAGGDFIIMDKREFFKRVVQMRHHQRKYFKTREKEEMVVSQVLETEIDIEIARSCIHDAEMEEYVRTEYPELIRDIDKFKYQQQSLFK